MSDLISRQDTLDAIQKRADEIDSVYSAFWEGLKIAQDIVEKVPSAEPERKKGYWIVKDEDWRKQLEWDECSECGFATTKQYNFCPNCGADM